MEKFSEIIEFVRKIYKSDEFIPLHAPVFLGNEKKYLNECIDTTFVSYVGRFVSRFEEITKEYTGAKHAVAIVNGTCALEIALRLCNVQRGDLVLTQALTFVATSNAISYTGAEQFFIDSDKDTLGMSVEKLSEFLEFHTEVRNDGFCYLKSNGKKITACVPVHIFGHSCRIDEIVSLCDKYNITVVEDAAESIGSTYKGKHTGTFGKVGIISYNGNKTVTTGGGGMIITDDEEIAATAKYITTTAKVPHPWEFFHDRLGYNYRMTNVNAAIGCAQMEYIDEIIKNKRETAALYKDFFEKIGIPFFEEKKDCYSNYWLNVVFLENREERESFLKYTNDHKVMTRPAWTLMNKLPMYTHCGSDDLSNAQWLEDRIVNIPSGLRK